MALRTWCDRGRVPVEQAAVGHGPANEAAQAAIRLGFESAGLEAILGLGHEEDTAPIRPYPGLRHEHVPAPNSTGSVVAGSGRLTGAGRVALTTRARPW
jgi:hypothetical protein